MEDWRARKAVCERASESWLRETVMSTMLPEDMEAGRRIDGNSICGGLVACWTVEGDGGERVELGEGRAY